MDKIQIFSFYEGKNKALEIELEINNFLEKIGPKILIEEFRVTEDLNYNLTTPRNYFLLIRYVTECYECPALAFAIKIFEDYDPNKVQEKINTWLEEKKGKIKIVSSQVSITSRDHKVTILYKIKRNN